MDGIDDSRVLTAVMKDTDDAPYLNNATVNSGVAHARDADIDFQAYTPFLSSAPLQVCCHYMAVAIPRLRAL